MKANMIFILKNKILEDKRQFTPHEYSKEIMYKSLRENILLRIDLIEQLRMRERKYLLDIDTHLARLKKKMNIVFELEPVAGQDPPTGLPKEEHKEDEGLIPPV